MDLLEDKASTRRQRSHPLADMLLQRLRSVQSKSGLGIATSAPEDQVASKLSFQSCRVHSLAGRLNGINAIQSRFDQVGQQLADSSAAMERHFDIGQLFGPLPQVLWRGLKNSRYILRGYERAGLHSQVVAENDDINAVPDRPEEAREVGQVDLHEPVEEVVNLLARPPAAS